MINLIFIKEFIAKITIFSLLFNIFNVGMFINTTFGEYSKNTTYIQKNSIGTMTGVSNFSTNYLNSLDNQEKLNIFTGTKLDFTFELSDIYSGALINYNYFTATGTLPVISGGYFYTGGMNQFSNNIDILTNGLTGTGLNLTLTGLVNGIYHIGIIPGNGEVFEEYMTGNVAEKAIDYEFIVDNIQKTGEIGFIAQGNSYSLGQEYTGEIAQNNMNLFMTGVNFSYDSYNTYYNTGGENVLFYTGIYNSYPANRLNIDFKNIPATLSGVNLVVGLVSGGQEYLTNPYKIIFDTALPILNPVVNTSSGEIGLSGQKVLMGTGQGMHYWIKFNERLIDNLFYKVDGVEASFSGTSSWNEKQGCILGNGGLVYGTMGAGNISISWYPNYSGSCSANKNYITGTNGETHTITLYGTDKLGREINPTNIVYAIDESIQDSNVQVIPLDYQIGTGVLKLPQILLAVPVSPIYATNTGTIVNLSLTGVSNGDILFYDYGIWGDTKYSFTGEIILNENDFFDFSQGFYDLELNFGDKFFNYTGTLLKLHVDVRTGSGERANNDFEYKHEFIDFIGQSGGIIGGGLSPGIINIIDSTHISLSGSLDFLGSQSWDRLDTYGPPTHYFFTEIGGTELVRIPYNFTGSMIEFPLSMSGKTVQIWGDFSNVGCNGEPTNCTNIKLTTSGSGFTNGSFTFPGEQNTINQTGFILSATGSNIITKTQTGYNISFTLSGKINQGDYLDLVTYEQGGSDFSDLFGNGIPNLILSGGQLTGNFNKAINFSYYNGTGITIKLKLYKKDGVKDCTTPIGGGESTCTFSGLLVDTYIYNVDFQNEIQEPVLETNISYLNISKNNEEFYSDSLCEFELMGESEKCYPFSPISYSLSFSLTGVINGNNIGNIQNEHGSYYKSYFRNTFTNSGSFINSNNGVYINNFEVLSLTGITSGTGIFKTEIYNSGHILLAKAETNLYLDNTLPTITGSYIKNNDGTFTLSVAGTDNTGIKGIYWYGNNGSFHGAGYEGSHFGTHYAFATGSSVTLNQTQTGYYATALDLAGNYKSILITLPNFEVPLPTNLETLNITQTGFTMSWVNTGTVNSYEILLNGTGITTVSAGTTSYTFDNLEPGKTYYVGVKSIKGNLKSGMIEKRVQTLGNSLNINLNVDGNCIDFSLGAYKEWISLNLSGSGFYYNSYASKELTSTSSIVSFDNLIAGDYQYDLWTGRCGYKTGKITVNNTTNETISVSAGKWIKTIVRENTISGNIVVTYNIEMTPNSTQFNGNDTKYVYVNTITGSILNIGNDNYSLKVRDNSWTAKNIIGIYSGANLDTRVSGNSILNNSSYSSGDTLTIVVQEGNVVAGNTNIGDGYISLYSSGINEYIAGTSIRNGKFAMMGIPTGDYKIQAYSYNYRYNNYEENLNISSDITNKSITFIQKDLNISGDFSKNFALEGKSISLKINPNQNSTGSLRFDSGGYVIESAKYKILNNSGALINSGIISDLDSSTNLVNLDGKTITVDLVLKNNISSDIKFLNASFNELELSLPIVRIDFSSPATSLANTDFVVRGSATANAIIHTLYNGEVIATGSTNINGVFEINTQIKTAGSGNILVKDISNNIISEGKAISIGSDLPIISAYDIKVDNVSKASSTENKLKYFSVWAKGDLTINSDLEIGVTISNNPSIKYFIGGIELINAKLAKGTYIGYGTKDIVVEYTKNGTTYTQTLAKMIVLIDPAGYVYNKYDNLKIPGLQATLYELQDKNGNRVTATGGVDMTKIAQYISTGYTKDDLANSITSCNGGGVLYPCTWGKYNSNGLGNESNPQITDSEGRYAWQTPEGYYYVEFKDIDGTTNGSYDTFESFSVIIPPEVTDLNVGSNYSSGYTIKETSINYDRSKSWTGSGFTSWSYTCKNSYTGNTCETITVVQNTSNSGGGGGSGGGNYINTTNNNSNITLNVNPINPIKTILVKKNLTKDEFKMIISNITKINITINGTKVVINKPKFDSTFNEKIDIITNNLNKIVIKKKLSKKDTTMLYNQYSIFLIGFKLHLANDSRGKDIAGKAISEMSKLLKK